MEMEFSNSIPFTNLRPIGQVNRMSTIANEVHLKQPIRGLRNGFHAPDSQSKPLPKRPETQETTRSPCSCLKCQLPSNADGAVRSVRLVSAAGFSLLPNF